MVLSSLNHEQRARYGYAISLQIINGREVPGGAWEFTEKKQGVIERNTKEGHDWNKKTFVEIISDISLISHLLKWDKMIAHFIEQNMNTSRKSLFTLFV